MKLYLLTISSGSREKKVYVLAKTPNEAQKMALGKWEKWNYTTIDTVVNNIGLVAEANQYGRPNILIIKGIKAE